MNLSCFICNVTGMNLRNSVSIFGTRALQSGKTLVEVVSEIIEKPIKEDVIHTKLLCKKCHKVCTEYDSIRVRMKVIQVDLLSQFKRTLPRHNLKYDTYNAPGVATPTTSVTTPVTSGTVTATNWKPDDKTKRIVVPASKLQPLPPDFLIKAGRFPLQRRGLTTKLGNHDIRILSPSTLNLKVTVGTSVLTQSIKTTSALTSKPQKVQVLAPTIKPVTSSIPATSVTPSMTSSPFKFDLAKELFSNNTVNSTLGVSNVASSAKQETNSDEENNEEQAMEIDEECSLAVITSEKDSKLVFENTSEKSDETKEEEYLDVNILQGLEGGRQELLLGKFQILDAEDAEGDEDNGHTIVMDAENGSILRVVSGQKLIYGGSEISLVVPQDGSDGDGQESNDEQIELQVSGDEETANAIIAAAQEQGGAFIKVESGEMFQVKSVQSKTGLDNERDDGGKADKKSFGIYSLVSKLVRGRFNCLLCQKENKSFEGEASILSQHLQSSHGTQVYPCDSCRLLFLEEQEYLDHLEKYTHKMAERSKALVCPICKKKCSSKQLLNEHVNAHSGVRPYKCKLCDKTFASKYTHQSHLKTHLDRPRPFKCEQCGKSFLTYQNLSQHEKTHSGVKDYICKVCGKAFGTQHNLKVHGVVHSGSRPFLCGVCGKAFARRAEVRDHMRIHTGERPFSCEICGASFTQRSNLHSHRRATHLDDKRYKCQLCPKRFKRRRLLDYHVKASHTGERPLQCEICKVTFVYPEHYKKHLRIHSGEKPYVCEVCGKSFNSRDNRNTHRFVHSDKKPYECLVCGAGYMRKQLLYHHMNTSGHLAESIVVNQPRVTKVDNVIPSTATVVLETGLGNAPTVTVADTIFDTTNGLQLATNEKSVGQGTESANLFISDDKIIIQDSKSTLNLVQDNTEASLLTLHNIEDEKGNSILDSVTAEQLVNAQSEGIMAEGATADGIFRLVQVRLPDGRSGWLAVDS